MNKKQYYTVELEVLAPVILKYRVFAENPNEAVDLIKSANSFSLLETPKPKLSNMKKIKAKVYKFGTSMLEFTKMF